MLARPIDFIFADIKYNFKVMAKEYLRLNIKDPTFNNSDIEVELLCDGEVVDSKFIPMPSVGDNY